MAKTTKKEETFKVSGEGLVNKVKEIIKQGNVWRITIKDKNKKTILDIPLTVGVIGIALIPVFAPVATIAALFAECTISVEREK